MRTIYFITDTGKYYIFNVPNICIYLYIILYILWLNTMNNITINRYLLCNVYRITVIIIVHTAKYMNIKYYIIWIWFFFFFCSIDNVWYSHYHRRTIINHDRFRASEKKTKQKFLIVEYRISFCVVIININKLLNFLWYYLSLIEILYFDVNYYIL